MQQQYSTGQASSARRNQVVIGLALSHEQFPLPQVVELGVQAEQAGFAAVWADDHFQPWQDNQEHCSLAWVTLAALGHVVVKETRCQLATVSLTTTIL